MNIISKILNLLFPPCCIACQKVNYIICDECKQKYFREPKTVKKLDFFDGDIIVALEDNKIIRKLIYKLKYKYDLEIITIFGEYLRKALVEKDTVHLVPVPLHKKRLRERGWNQSEKLAKCTGFFLDDVLIRKRYTEQQMKLDRENRQKNVKDAFECTRELDADIHYMIVDDFATTGSTLKECKIALEKMGAKKISGAFLVRAS